MTMQFNMRSVSVALLAALSLAACGQSGESSVKKSFDDGFEKQFVESFGASCEAGAVNSGAPAKLAKDICKCTAETLAEKHEASELMAMTPEKATPTMKECAKKSGIPL